MSHFDNGAQRVQIMFLEECFEWGGCLHKAVSDYCFYQKLSFIPYFKFEQFSMNEFL